MWCHLKGESAPAFHRRTPGFCHQAARLRPFQRPLPPSCPGSCSCCQKPEQSVTQKDEDAAQTPPVAFSCCYICTGQEHVIHHNGHRDGSFYHPSLLPEVVEICKLQRSVAVCEEFTVTFICHVTLHRFCRVERSSLLVTP